MPLPFLAAFPLPKWAVEWERRKCWMVRECTVGAAVVVGVAGDGEKEGEQRRSDAGGSNGERSEEEEKKVMAPWWWGSCGSAAADAADSCGTEPGSGCREGTNRKAADETDSPMMAVAGVLLLRL